MHTTAELIEDIRSGKMVILVDDEDRENEGDLVIASDFITPEAINFMATQARGLICLAMTAEQIKRLGIPQMVSDDINFSPNKTAFTVSIEAASGVSTGISAADRSHTIRVASHPSASPRDIIVPGHVFPIRAQEGGVLKRAGHTEASVDLARLAGLNSAAVICEIMKADGSMARVPDLKAFAQEHNLKMGTIEDLIQYRIENESFVEEKACAELPSSLGQGFKVHVFENKLDGYEHLVISKGPIDPNAPVLVRVHTECLVGDLFGSLRTRSGEYLRRSIDLINQEGAGLLVYLRLESMEGRLVKRIEAYARADQGEVVSERQKQGFRSDKKDYGIGAQILRAMGVRKIRLMSNSPKKRVGLKGYGLEIVETIEVPIDTDPLRLLVNESEPTDGERAWS
ncbi:MAG: 3,4-dihydroxy-2-butanone-4-phosphate synthase [Pseudobdellovibrionaceae bacterium]|nr:MAG: 3,4-dihydroxy-2-butanone-4-phosphate synthase [Pseudobdellovibrionaceae bacterium]